MMSESKNHFHSNVMTSSSLTCQDPDDQQRPSMRLEVTIKPSESTENTGSLQTTRTGSLKLSHRLPVECPSLVVSTRLGSIPHLTPQLVNNHLPKLTALHLNLDDFFTASNRPPPFTQAPFDLHRYIGFSSACPCLLSMGIRPPSSTQPPLKPNTDHHITIKPSFGTMQLHIDNFIRSSLARPPDFLFAMADHPYHPNPGNNRLVKSLDRSFRWLSSLVRSAEGVTNVFAELVGSTNPVLVDAFSRGLQTRLLNADQAMSAAPADSPKLADCLAGFVYPLSAVRVSLPFHSILPLIHTAFAPLPPHKVRAIHGPRGPHEILQLSLSTGVDLFIDEWTSDISSLGIALNFRFPPSPSSPPGAPIGWNLYDERFAQDFETLSLPATSPPTKAYVHHLLQTHEMSAHVFLSLHNHAHMSALLCRVRRLLETGLDAFTEAVEAFKRAYAVPDELEHQARVAWAAVKSARGKGRPKK